MLDIKPLDILSVTEISDQKLEGNYNANKILRKYKIGLSTTGPEKEAVNSKW